MFTTTSNLQINQLGVILAPRLFRLNSPPASLDEFGELRHVVRQDGGGPQSGEVVVGVGRGQAGNLAAPLGAELDTETLQGPHSAPDKDGAICKYSNIDIDIDVWRIY